MGAEDIIVDLAQRGPQKGWGMPLDWHMVRRAAVGAFFGWAFAAVPAAEAQVPPGITNPVPQGSPVERVLPPAPPTVSPGAVIQPPPAPGSEVPNRPVRVDSVDVEGATAYPRPEIAQLTEGLVGPAVPLPKIDAARQAILQLYRGDGYVLSTVDRKSVV